MRQFQCFTDLTGDVFCADGWVSQHRTGARFAVGSGTAFGASLAGESGQRFRPVAGPAGTTFLGGSGRGLATTGLTAAPSGPPVPVGRWLATVPNTWVLGIFTLAVTGSSAATIHDGTDTVATLSTGGTAPVGDYVATTYGETTYGGSATFTIAAVAEDSAPGSLPDADVSLSAGTAQDGTYEGSTAALWVSATDSDWTIVIDPSGSAEMRYLTTVVAERAEGLAYDPSGAYVATASGETTYNGGEAWTAWVGLVRVPPRAGSVYLELIESSGGLSEVNGPFYGTLPTDSGETYYFALAEFDGAGGEEQMHDGPLVVS